MTRGKGGGDDWGRFLLVLLGLSVGAVALYYLESGRGEESNAALIPDRLEDQIDLAVRRLNERFGHDWVKLGLDALESYLKIVLPWQVVTMVGAIYQIELMSEANQINRFSKQQAALRLLRA